MLRTTRAALSAVVPSAALAVAVVFASAALAPEAVPAPEPSSSTLAVAATAAPRAVPSDETPEGAPCCSDATDAGGSAAAEGDPSTRAEPTEDVEPGVTGAGVTGAGVSEPGAVPSSDPIPEEQQDEGVDVRVSIAPPSADGSLSMTVAGASATLTESGSSAEHRQFVGVLPTVTVTDGRDAERIPAGAAWFVLASSGDFTGAGRDSIGGEHLGWVPALLGEDGPAAAGDRVDSVLDGGTGVRDAVLLAAAEGSAAAAGASWSASADLVLRTSPTVAAGSYTSTLTLSLFE